MSGSLRHLAFLLPGNWREERPAEGLEDALRVFVTGERLGFDSGWVRQRHLERNISSAPTFLAAASQRTQRLGLGVAVIQLGYENLFRLAEDLATVDLLARGRLQVGVSAGAPPYAELLGTRLVEGDPSVADFSHARVLRLRENLEGDWLADDSLVESAAGAQRPRLQPYAPGLSQRLWYGAGSLGSAAWAGQSGLHLLIGNVVRAEASDDFHVTQGLHLDRYLAAWDAAGHASPPRVALGRVIVPTDSASLATRRRYADWAASRVQRTLAPQGPRRTLFPLDLVGSTDQIAEALWADPVFARTRELRIELPYDLDAEDYEQILTDVATRLAPAFGWTAG